MEKLSAIAQISILLLIAFLIGIFMAWLYWRRRYSNQRTFEGETKDLEIQRLSGELKRYSTVFEGKSPEVFLKNQEDALISKENEISSLKTEMGKITYEGRAVSPDAFLEKVQAELGVKEKELTRFKEEAEEIQEQLNELQVDGIILTPAEFLARREAELESKSAEIFQLSQAVSAPTPIKTSSTPPSDSKAMEHLGQLRWKIADKDTQIRSLEAQLAEKTQTIYSLSAELGQMKFVDMDGEEKTPFDLVAQLRGEIEDKASEIERLGTEATVQTPLPDTGMAERLGELRWELSDKDEKIHSLQAELADKRSEVTSLHAEIGQFKFVDMDGVEKSPLDLVSQLRGEIENKEFELEKLVGNLSAEAQQEGTKIAEHLGELRWELSEKEEQLNTLHNQLAAKSQELNSLSAEMGQWKFTDMDGIEKGPLDFLSQLRGEIEKKDAELESLQAKLEVGAQEQEGKMAEQNHASKLAEQLGELRWTVSEKDEQLGALQNKLAEKTSALTSLGAELSQFKFVDMDGIERSPFDLLGQLREEIESKDAELTQLQNAKEEKLQENEVKMAEKLGELRWVVSEQAAKVESLESQLTEKAKEAMGLSAELGQMKFVDMDGVEKSPFDLISGIRGELESKEAEVLQIQQDQQAAIQERETKIDQLSNDLVEKGARVEALETQLAQNSQSLENELQQKNQELLSKDAEILQLSGQLAQLQVEGNPVSPEEFSSHMSGALEAKSSEILSLKAQQQAIGLNNGETLSEFMARKNMEFDAQSMELQQLKEKLSQVSWGGIPVSLDEYMAKREAEVEAKNSEINHLLEELAQLQLDGVQLRPVDFSQRMQQLLTEKDQDLQGKSLRITELEGELEKLKYVASDEKLQEDEESLEWREREAELVRLSAENEQLRRGYTDRGISIDEAYVDFIPKEIYDLLVEYGDEGISLSNHNGYFLVFNERLQELTGYSKEEANDTSEKIFLEKIYPDPIYRTQVGRQIQNIPEDGSFNSIRTQITTKEGMHRGLDVSSTTFYHKGMKYYLSAYVDVAES
ncbi:MAG: PAS domain S-box protein [Bacteroidota bacterium]